jgi:hypothetical protein
MINRPDISNLRNPEYCLQTHGLLYWSLGRYDKNHAGGGLPWKTFQRLYDADWVGLTISYISEYVIIKKFLRNIAGNYYKYTDYYNSVFEGVGSLCFLLKWNR